MNTFWTITFWLATAWMIYTYAGYPLILLLQKKRQARRQAGDAAAAATISDAELPPIAVVIIARNAASQIGPKIQSCLDSDYPQDRIRVLLAIDGPDEATAQAAEALNDPRIRVMRTAQHRGKAATLNEAVALCEEPILIMSDARQRLAPDAIRHLVESLLREPAKAAISGELQFEVPEGDFVGQGLDAYWRYEKWLRRTESEVASTIGMTGALYAMRREAFRPIPAETVLDDVLIPMQMVLDGHRAGFDTRAVAFDLPSASMEQERRRKIRTLAGNFQLIELCPTLINPLRNPAFFGFFSHKVCRLLTPVALLLMLIGSAALAGTSLFFALALAAALATIGLSIVARLAPTARRWLPVRLANTFVEMHLFIVYGYLEYLRNPRLHLWSTGASASGRGTDHDGPLRVLYIVSLFPCWSETFIVREIRALQTRGADIRILSLKPASEPMVQPDAEQLLDRVIYPPVSLLGSLYLPLTHIVRHPLRSFRELWQLVISLWSHPVELAKSLITWWRTLAVIAPVHQFEPDHIHAHWATYPSTSARILAGRINRPWSFTGHAHDIFVHDHDLTGKLCQADFSVTISGFNRSKLSARMPLNLRDRLNVIHCGILPDEIPFNPRGRQRERIVAVGRLDPIKGFVHLVEACRLLRNRGVDFQCDIIGEGPLRASLQLAIDQAHLGERVRLTGALPQQEVRQRIADAAVFVLPSVLLPDGNADGIPVALMEAMASGAAAVSTRVSGIPELIEDNVSGLLVAPGNAAALADAITRLLADEPLRIRLAEMARHRIIQDFDANIEAGKLLKLMRPGVPDQIPHAANDPQLQTLADTDPAPALPAIPLRIMIMTDEMEVGGSQRQIVLLAKGLKALGIECVVVYFINPSFLVDELHAAGIQTLRVDKRKRIDPAFVRHLRRTIQSWRPDVVHCFSFTAELWGAMAIRLLPRDRRPALISSVRGTYEWYSAQQWRMKRWVSQRSQAIVSNSREGALYAARQMNWPLANFSIVANGVQVAQPAEAQVQPLRQKYLSGAEWASTIIHAANGTTPTVPSPGLDGVLLLFVGRLVEHKNLPRLLDAFASIADRYPEARLLLVGSGPLGPSLMDRINRLGLSAQVEMLGERDDVAALMAASDIVVAPSLREGLSNVILEAMALGRPVIATHVGGTPDLIESGVCGLLVDPLDTAALATAIERLIEHPDLRLQLGSVARIKVSEQYGPQVMVKAMLKEYQRVGQR